MSQFDMSGLGVPSDQADPMVRSQLSDFAWGAVRAASREAGVHGPGSWSECALRRLSADCAAFLAANPRPRADLIKAGADFWRLRKKLNLAAFAPLAAYVEDGAVRLRTGH